MSSPSAAQQETGQLVTRLAALLKYFMECAKHGITSEERSALEKDISVTVVQMKSVSHLEQHLAEEFLRDVKAMLVCGRAVLGVEPASEEGVVQLADAVKRVAQTMHQVLQRTAAQKQDAASSSSSSSPPPPASPVFAIPAPVARREAQVVGMAAPASKTDSGPIRALLQQGITPAASLRTSDGAPPSSSTSGSSPIESEQPTGNAVKKHSLRNLIMGGRASPIPASMTEEEMGGPPILGLNSSIDSSGSIKTRSRSSSRVSIFAAPNVGEADDDTNANYNDGSSPPPFREDLATSFSAQQNLFMNKYEALQVPWVLDYLTAQILKRLQSVPTQNLSAMLPEARLAPFDETYVLGFQAWVTSKDDFEVPYSLLKRYLWHLPTPLIPDVGELAEAWRESADVEGVLKDMPLLKRAALVHLTGFFREVVRVVKKDGDLAAAFAPILFHCSASASQRLKIPLATDVEVDMIRALIRSLNVEDHKRKVGKEIARNKHMSVASTDPKAYRVQLHKMWTIVDNMRESQWLMPLCKKCGWEAASWKGEQIECPTCRSELFQYPNGNPAGLQRALKVVSGFQLELGSQRVSAAPPYQKPVIEQPWNFTQPFQELFAGKPHIHVVVLGGPEGKSIVALAAVETPDTVIPARVLVMHPKEGYWRTVLEPEKKLKGNPKEVLSELTKNLAFVERLGGGIRLVAVADSRQRELSDAFLDFESKSVSTVFKFGVLYAAPGQTTEEDFYNNQGGSPAYEQLLNILGERVSLAQHTRFRGGLDCSGKNSTGSHSVYTSLVVDPFTGELRRTAEEPLDVSLQVMFHVGTLLDFSDNNRQQLPRKRHVGNDVVVLVFNESGAPVDPSIFASQFNHVFVVVTPRKMTPSGLAEEWQVAVATKPGVHPFQPLLEAGNPILKLHDVTAAHDWMIAKLINAEKGAMYAKNFSVALDRTRTKMIEYWESQGLLKGKKVGSMIGGIGAGKVLSRRGSRSDVRDNAVSKGGSRKDL